jgi:hypothetical protein
VLQPSIPNPQSPIPNRRSPIPTSGTETGGYIGRAGPPAATRAGRRHAGRYGALARALDSEVRRYGRSRFGLGLAGCAPQVAQVMTEEHCDLRE